MSIRWKLANSAIIMMIIAGGIICFLNYHKAKSSMTELAKKADNALTARALDQLASIRSSQANHIKSFFETIVNQVKTLSDDRMIIDACQCFKNLFFTTSSFFQSVRYRKCEQNLQQTTRDLIICKILFLTNIVTLFQVIIHVL